MGIGHVLGNYGQKRFAIGSKCRTHVFRDLLHESKRSRLFDECLSLHTYTLLTKSFYFNGDSLVTRDIWHVSIFHLEVKFKFSVGKEGCHEHRHELCEIFAKKASELCESTLDSFALRIIV